MCSDGQIVGYRQKPTDQPKSPDPQPTPKVHKASTGTGFLVSLNGILVTAYHVIEGASNIEVRFAGEEWKQATLVGFSRNTDVAILKINPAPISCLSLKPTDALYAGDPVFTVGYPVVELLGPEAKYTDGKISSLSGVKGEDSIMQITVPVQPGNSGGPLVSSDGKAVGLITSTAAVKYFYAITDTLPQNINWAVKSDYILPMLKGNESECNGTIAGNLVKSVSRAVCLVKAD